MEIINIVVLLISGLLIFTVAGMLRLISPINNFLKISGIELANDVNLLSEARGICSVMMFGGIIVMLGTVIPELTITSFIVAILLFFGYAFGRILSILLDGKPNKQLIQGLIAEIILGSANIFCLVNIMT